MRRATTLVAAVLAVTFVCGLSAQPVLAGEAVTAGGNADAKAGGDAKPGTRVDMPILVAPMIVHGRLLAYAYINSTVITNSADTSFKVRDKIPFIQDAFIRDVNGASIVDPKNTDKVDRPALQARLLADLRKVMGQEEIVSVSFSNLQITQLRPGGN
jgi:hypothetical protein